MNHQKQKSTITPSQFPPPSNSAGRHEGEKDGRGLKKSELVSVAFQLGFIIAIPVVVFGYFGKWLDARLDSYPLLTLIGILTAIVFTSVWIYRKFKGYFKNSGDDLSRPSATLQKDGEGKGERSNHDS